MLLPCSIILRLSCALRLMQVDQESIISALRPKAAVKADFSLTTARTSWEPEIGRELSCLVSKALAISSASSRRKQRFRALFGR